ncbi:type VII secretion protein EccB [Actinoplanes utahensis]|uniref:Type VII secretion protein EccB n=1 Tax=Actinoplanes utahensis TaxID=1869 RepID=A0A0A6UCY8_ACTUT|nr:type VII secretion protein EccB [Actinoplanes utahensis]KHD72938.1 hypothetical protein MB27_37605 [Actinoplanes utahensis]GIF31103.1 type VII secretion protein EccB [Actinoplanes utahensis]
MPSRQDELHSYQYSVQRVVAALVSHDPDPQRSPLRRAGVTALVSLLIAALVVGGFAVYGLFTGNTMAQANDPSAVLVEKKTGARYVYLESDRKLHPVLNYTSGMLLATGNPPALKTVAAEKLAKVPLGEPLGILGAPDSLPTDKNLLKDTWSICTSTVAGKPKSTLVIGTGVPQGKGAPSGGLLVKDNKGRTFLVFEGKRHLLPTARADATLRVLGWYGSRPWIVSSAWVDAIPSGSDLAAPVIPGYRGASVIRGRKVGQVLTLDGSSYAMVLADGVAPLSELQLKLLTMVPGAGRPITVGEQEWGNNLTTSKIGMPSTAADLPLVAPKLAAAPSTACMTATLKDEQMNLELRTGIEIPAGRTPVGMASVDLVHMPRGKGAVVESVSSPDAPAGSGTVSLITDNGVQFALASRELLGKFGYGKVTPTRIPSQLVDYLPVGPALDPVQAGPKAS